MELFIERENKNQKIKFSGTGQELLEKFNINTEEVIVIKNEEIVSLDEELGDSDVVKVITVISGG